MNQRGFVLITVLWVIAALSGLVGVGFSAVQTGVKAGSNRIYLTRIENARVACEAILRGRFRADTPLQPLDTVDLGRGTWCLARVWDPSDRLPINDVDEWRLARLLQWVADSARADSLAHAFMDWRDADGESRLLGAEGDWYREMGRRPPRDGPIAHTEELRYIKGFTPGLVDTVGAMLTVRSDGRVNLNSADVRVLAATSALSSRAAEFIVRSRTLQGRLGSHEQVGDALTRAQMPLSFDEYRKFVRATVVSTNRIVARIEAGIEGLPLRATAVVTFGILDGSLEPLRRELS
jgi:type II secretory pathway component PulK